MPNKHIEHPEDNLFNGVDPYDAGFSSNLTEYQQSGMSTISCLAKIVITTGLWALSLFNKVKVKINRSPAEIIANHGEGNVANILMACFYALPRDVMGIYQADFIGFGGDDTYQPNTIEYVFPNVQTRM